MKANGRLVGGVSITGSSITGEAATYLIPLLDALRDREEIAVLQERGRLLGVGPRGVSPVVIPLRAGTVAEQIIDTRTHVQFDADGSGVRKNWSWITPAAGWLVYAPEGDRRITSALQMFGHVTFWLFWDNGYQALASLDDDGNGVLEGRELRNLAIWQDLNSNGIADDGEVKPLADWGVVSLNCAHEDTRTRRDYIAWSPKGVTFTNGETRPTYDVMLYTKPAATE